MNLTTGRGLALRHQARPGAEAVRGFFAFYDDRARIELDGQVLGVRRRRRQKRVTAGGVLLGAQRHRDQL